MTFRSPNHAIAREETKEKEKRDSSTLGETASSKWREKWGRVSNDESLFCAFEAREERKKGNDYTIPSAKRDEVSLPSKRKGGEKERNRRLATSVHAVLTFWIP